MSAPDHRPAADEYAARLARVRERMHADDIDACLVLAPESQCWLSGLESFISGVLAQALVVTADEGAPMVLVVWDAGAPLAHETSIVDDIRTYRFGVDDPVEVFAAVLAECAPEAGRIGLDSSSRAVPHALGAGTGGADRARPGRSTARRRWRTRGWSSRPSSSTASVAPDDMPTSACALPSRPPGRACRNASSRPRSSTPCAGPGPTTRRSPPSSPRVHGRCSATAHRRIASLEAGDLVHVEIGGVEARYNAVGLQTFCVGGAAPPAAGVRLYDVALLCLRAGLDAIHPGVEAHAVEAPALEILRDAGLGEVFKMRFGYGVGIGYPPTWLDPLQITRTSTQRLVAGTTFVLHACLLDEPASVGVVVGGTYAVTERGIEALAGAGAIELAST